MVTIEQKLTQLLKEYDNNKNLCPQNLENCEIILQRYKSKLYVDHLTYKLALNVRSVWNIEPQDCKVIFHESFNSDSDIIEKVDIQIKETVLNIRYETVTEKKDTREGIKVYVFYKFYLDNQLVLKKEKDNKTRDIIKLSYIIECIKRLDLDLTSFLFLDVLLTLFTDATPLAKLIEQLRNERNIGFFKKTFDSDSDMAIDLSND